jgi:hypothetical protein
MLRRHVEDAPQPLAEHVVMTTGKVSTHDRNRDGQVRHEHQGGKQYHALKQASWELKCIIN